MHSTDCSSYGHILNANQRWSTTAARGDSKRSLALLSEPKWLRSRDFFEKPEFNFMNKSVLLWFKQAIPSSWIGVKQELDFKIFFQNRIRSQFAWIRSGVGVQKFRLRSPLKQTWSLGYNLSEILPNCMFICGSYSI